MKKTIPLYHLKQMYMSAFRKKNTKKAINSLKSLEAITDIRDVVDSLGVVYPNLRNQIEGVLYPKSLVELSEKNSTFFKPISLQSELNWALAYMRGQWMNLSWFSKQKCSFEHNFMLSNYDECNRILESIKEKLGISLWYYEAKCLLLEYSDKRSDCIELVSSILEECQDNKNYIPSLFYYLHERVSRKVSPYKYDEDLNALYKRNRTDLHEDYYKYLLFRLNYYNHYANIDLSLPIMFESLSSLVDRYLIMLTVIKTGLVRERASNEVYSRALYLYHKTRDKALYPILAAMGHKMPDDYFDERFVYVLDSYYSGEYVLCLKHASALMTEDSSFFDVYIIYCRSLIYLQREYACPPSVTKGSLIDEVCKHLYKVLTYDDVEENIHSLYQINKNLYSFSLAADMDFFIKTECNEPTDHLIKAINTRVFDPMFVNIWAMGMKSVEYLDAYIKKHGDTVSCNIWKKKILNELVEDANLPDHIKDLVNAEYYFRNENFEEAYKRYNALYRNSWNCVPRRQTAVARMIECLFKEGKIQFAINHYVNYYIDDLPSVSKVDTASIIKHLQDNLYEGVRRNIELVIFVALTCKDTIDKSFVLFEFCEIQGVRRPSDLISSSCLSKYKTEVIELFFLLMNDDETLRHYINIESFKERLAERKKILQYVISLGTPKKEYSQLLLKKVEDALLVYNLSKNIDESKIYANDDAIIKYKLNEIDGIYSRYRLLLDTVIKKRKNIYVVNMSNPLFFDNNDKYEKESQSQISINSNGLYDVFYTLYSEIREQFLNSDYGLVAYLSTRVRHGELETMLRPEMAQRNLILSIKDKKYQPNEYWSTVYNLKHSEFSVIYDALTSFSESFDSAVTYLIKQKLQIFDTDQKPDGLFDYEVTEEELAYKAMEIGLLLSSGKDDKISFCQLMLKWLWEKTEVSLQKIRDYVDHEFMDTITCSINNLETTIKDNLTESYVKTDLLSEIRAAREAIIMKIQKVSKWFTVSQPKIEDADFKVVSHQVYNSVRLSHTNCKTDDRLSITGETFKIKSDYVIHYADVLRNVVYNMFEHGIDASDGKRHMVLNVKITKEQVILNLVNDADGDPEELNRIFQKKLQNSGAVSQEGGSGIAKANKILKSDLNNDANSISMVASEGKVTTVIVVNLNGFRVK